MSNSSNNDKKSESGINIDKITDFCKKNVKYISAGVLTVALVVVLAVTATNKSKNEDADKQNKVQQEEQQQEQPEVKEDEYEVDTVPEVKELISTYYNSYAAGDVKKLASITESLSDMEKSYIKMMNEYVEGYSNITCYTKDGLEEGSYMVSATFDMKFAGTEGTLPGMDFFYIKTKEDGKLCIDNLYSSFNRQIKEQETDEKIDALIESFENGEDVQQLQKEFQDKYDKAVKEDENLQKMADTVAETIRNWANSYTPDDSKEDEKKDEQPEKNTDEKKDEQSDATQEDEKKDEQSDENTKDKQEETPQEEPQQEEPQENNDNSNEGNSSGLNYVPEGTVLTANDGYNVRVSMSETAELVGTTAIGDSIKVVLSYAEGWTKVEWNGKTGYIKTDLLLNN